MNLHREDAFYAMDAITGAGYTASMTATPQTRMRIPGFKADEVVYRVTLLALSYDSQDLRALCDLAESVDLVCRHSLNEFRFEYESDDR